MDTESAGISWGALTVDREDDACLFVTVDVELFQGERMGLSQKIRLLVGSLKEEDEVIKLEGI